MSDQITSGINDSAQSLGRWVLWYALQSNGLYVEGAVVLFILALCVFLLHQIDTGGTSKPTPKEPKIVTTASKPSGPVFIPFDLGNVTIDLQPRRNETIHTAIGGSSGLGKSSAILPILNLPIGVLVIALDNTRPITEAIRQTNGIEWTNEPNWPIGLDLLRGDSRTVSEVLVEGWTARSSEDTGKWRRLARGRLWTTLDEMDQAGCVRNIPDLAEALWQDSGNAEINRACRDWASRLGELARTLGGSLGHDLDIVDAMRRNQKVLLRVNPFIDPLDSPMLSGMLLVHARRATQATGVPFICVVEEAGQMAMYQNEIIPLAQAARDRGVPLIVLTQNLSKLPIEVANNISAWVSFAQEDKREMDFIAHKLRLEPKQLQREAFPGRGEQQGRGWCYVRAPGVHTTLVHINLPKRSKPTRELVKSIPKMKTHTWEPVQSNQINGWRPWVPALAAPVERVWEKNPRPWWVGSDPDMLRFWDQMRRTKRPIPLWSPERGVWWDEQGCLEWWGPLSKPKDSTLLGRPRSNIGRGSVTVYVETARAAGKSSEPTWDHCCDQPVCVDPEHGYACSITQNNRNRKIRTIHLEQAWLERFGQIPPWWLNRHHERVAVS